MAEQYVSDAGRGAEQNGSAPAGDPQDERGPSATGPALEGKPVQRRIDCTGSPTWLRMGRYSD